MPYIGTSPSNGVRRVFSYTATASQTTFSGASNEGASLAYADTTYIDVYQNGVLLDKSDYTSTSGTSVVLDTGASADDVVVIIVYDVLGNIIHETKNNLIYLSNEKNGLYFIEIIKNNNKEVGKIILNR